MRDWMLVCGGKRMNVPPAVVCRFVTSCGGAVCALRRQKSYWMGLASFSGRHCSVGSYWITLPPTGGRCCVLLKVSCASNPRTGVIGTADRMASLATLELPPSREPGWSVVVRPAALSFAAGPTWVTPSSRPRRCVMGDFASSVKLARTFTRYGLNLALSLRTLP